MDVDDDGIVKVDHVMRVIELLGRHHVNVSNETIDQIVDMLVKEEMLSVEADIEQVLEKSLPDDENKSDATRNDEVKKVSMEKVGEMPKTISRKISTDVAKDLSDANGNPDHIKDMFEDDKKDIGGEKTAAAVQASDNNGDKDGPMNLK